MTIRVDVAPAVLSWALDVTGADEEGLHRRFKVDKWLNAEARPTLKQLQDFARAAGVPFGYLLLPQPPAWSLPVPDFREGFESTPTPSANLVAVLGQSQRRQEWYRDYVLGLGSEPLEFVGSAASLEPIEAAERLRGALGFEVSARRGTWADTRKALLRSFEALGGLTVATSMVDNNTRRTLDENEFRGFALIDDIAPLVFVNTHQTLNGQIFTLAHEFAHVWRGASAIGNEDPPHRGTVRDRALVQCSGFRSPGATGRSGVSTRRGGEGAAHRSTRRPSARLPLRHSRGSPGTPPDGRPSHRQLRQCLRPRGRPSPEPQHGKRRWRR